MSTSQAICQMIRAMGWIERDAMTGLPCFRMGHAATEDFLRMCGDQPETTPDQALKYVEEARKEEREAAATFLTMAPCGCEPKRTGPPEMHDSPLCPAYWATAILSGMALDRFRKKEAR